MMSEFRADGSHTFGVMDYTVFASMLLVSAVIGFYHGCDIFNFKKNKPKAKNNAVGEFLTANGEMSTLPVALSMLASFLSSITLMGQPAEVYLYGPQLWLFGLSSLIIVPIVGNVMVPFFRDKNYTSAYQYFGDRFNRKLQFLTSFLFSIQMVLYLALVLYAPALAMHQVTGFNTMRIVTIMYVVCIFYTTLGGMKAVVWTDTFQVLVLYAAMVIILIKGTLDIGGVGVIWQRNTVFNRTDFFNFHLDPTERYTAFSSLIGSGFLHMAFYGGNQLQVQRYFTVKSNEQAKRMLWVNCFGWTIVVVLTVYTGMLIFAKYCYCDPLLTGAVKTPDQLFPLYVMETLKDYPGIPGLFIAGIFSAGLSTLSTGVNSLAAIWFIEMQHLFKDKLTDRQAGFTVKGIALLFGVLSYMMVFLVPYMGGLVPVAISLSGVFAGSIFGLFLLGMFVKRANSVGGTVGLVSSISLLVWLNIGALYSERMGQNVNPRLPASTAQCSANITSLFKDAGNSEDAMVLYRISYLWYCLIALSTTLIVGFVVSVISECLFPTNSEHFAAPNLMYCDKIHSSDKDSKVNQLLLCEEQTKCRATINTGSPYQSTTASS
ncbi:sodium-coupled monocarboxylate transporter 1 isoform X1 [Nilaparvata lugens]|uniref:sodium-coupled monocarboxylate transporter 1 isoform X1 n=3 Tax=Nilaparvata lugens TaxID=108931 RepID=UPI00193CAA9E|nr:sodium-coupled monocarboxylate transporter 1 isoform X1 [Nilaparvata lugens]